MTHEEHCEIADDVFLEIVTAIIHNLSTRQSNDKVSSALLCLLVRNANTWKSLRLLRKYTPPGEAQDSFMIDAGTLLRAMFDALFQADSIYRDPGKRAERAELYFDFAHVERYKAQEKALRHDNPLAAYLKASPLKPEGERRLQQEFDRVKSRYSKNNKSTTREKWYESNLGKLMKNAGREAEYDVFVTRFNGCVHSSALVMQWGPSIKPESLMYFASALTAPVALMNLDCNHLDIGEHRMILEELSKGMIH